MASAKWVEGVPCLMRHRLILGGLTGLALLLQGCGDNKNSLAEVDEELIGAKQSDPALTAALEDQILVDPAL